MDGSDFLIRKKSFKITTFLEWFSYLHRLCRKAFLFFFLMTNESSGNYFVTQMTAVLIRQKLPQRGWSLKPLCHSYALSVSGWVCLHCSLNKAFRFEFQGFIKYHASTGTTNGNFVWQRDNYSHGHRQWSKNSIWRGMIHSSMPIVPA